MALMKHQHNEEECAVCGAAVRRRGWRKFTTGDTCDGICKRAKATGRTRHQQIKAEIQADERADRAREMTERLDAKMYARAVEDSNYNRPYLAT